MRPQEFVEKWANSTLGERQTYQLHFSDICRLVGHDPPDASGTDSKGKLFQFEKYVREKAGGRGFADVYYEDHFAIEYKAPNRDKDLNDAFRQLQRYQRQLKIPPLLIVTDIENWRIHTNFTNTVPKVYAFTNADIADKPEVFYWLKYIFDNPERFNPERNTIIVTEEASYALKTVVDDMRQEWNLSPERVARFFTRIVFSMFAEDIELLPTMSQGKGLFTYMVEHTYSSPENFQNDIGQLFKVMEDGGRLHSRDIRWFNGALFKDVQVEKLAPAAIARLLDACLMNWEYVEPAIFGTLFERCLDPSKRAQLGAHYTSPADILLIVEPVLMRPLRREWDAVREEALPWREKYNQSRTVRARETAKARLLAFRDKMLKRVRDTTVLDPACGSGNFLYIALQQLMNLELDIVTDPLWHDIDRADLRVSPRQLYGIEIDEIAHALTSIVVWIGYIQWREHHGYHYDAKPLLEDLSDNIVRKDAILPALHPHPPPEETRRGDSVSRPNDESPRAVEWPPVDVIVGNPPFLGGKKMRTELGNYVDRLFNFYRGRVPPEADLVCYWFEKAREHIENGKVKRAGLLATNSIRGGANREVLKRIKETGGIFMAWSDREWILDGAAVRVSMVGFDDSSESTKYLNGRLTLNINPDLTSRLDLTSATVISMNDNLAFMGVTPGAKFDIPAELAAAMIRSNKKNQEVLRPYLNAVDITRRYRNVWTIDFGVDASEYDASQYIEPFQYVSKAIKPSRLSSKQPEREKAKWWLYTRTRPALRKATASLSRAIATPMVSKHRVFIWIPKDIVPANLINVIARDDDYFFGVLHSKLHEVWSLRMGTSLEDRPRYTPTTTFETFPFPWSPGREDTSHPAHARVSQAAKQLHEERHAWLNPEDASAKQLKDRTLTNLYNALAVFRERDSMKTKAAAADFAPRLDELHRALDEAVCDAYGWEYSVLNDEEEILRRLLELNLSRAG
ncbi:MAG: N-6 DNA methylase [Chloroflexi bacterium]|nr:N-6 DNA methylase [Chloroflexota bacterium]